MAEGVAAIILGESQAKFAIVCSDMSKFAETAWMSSRSSRASASLSGLRRLELRGRGDHFQRVVALHHVEGPGLEGGLDERVHVGSLPLDADDSLLLDSIMLMDNDIIPSLHIFSFNASQYALEVLYVNILRRFRILLCFCWLFINI